MPFLVHLTRDRAVTNQLEVKIMIEQKIAQPVELTDDDLDFVAGGLTLSGASGVNAVSNVNNASSTLGQSFVAFGALTAATGAGGGNFT
jgi:hypothetical protein